MLKPTKRYANRKEAGRALALELKKYAGFSPVVIGLPRGGVVIAAEIARELNCDLDVILAGKLRAPFNPELAIGAVSETGLVFLNADVLKSVPADAKYVEEEKTTRLGVIKERLKAYRSVKKKIPLQGRTVIIADDGLATGSTMTAAVQAVRAEGAEKIVVAVPGGPAGTVNAVASMEGVHEVVCPVVPPAFYAVGQLYVSFEQTEDSEVIALLKEFEKGEKR